MTSYLKTLEALGYHSEDVLCVTWNGDDTGRTFFSLVEVIDKPKKCFRGDHVHVKIVLDDGFDTAPRTIALPLHSVPSVCRVVDEENVDHVMSLCFSDENTRSLYACDLRKLPQDIADATAYSVFLRRVYLDKLSDSLGVDVYKGKPPIWAAQHPELYVIDEERLVEAYLSREGGSRTPWWAIMRAATSLYFGTVEPTRRVQVIREKMRAALGTRKLYSAVGLLMLRRWSKDNGDVPDEAYELPGAPPKPRAPAAPPPAAPPPAAPPPAAPPADLRPSLQGSLREKVAAVAAWATVDMGWIQCLNPINPALPVPLQLPCGRPGAEGFLWFDEYDRHHLDRGTAGRWFKLYDLDLADTISAFLTDADAKDKVQSLRKDRLFAFRSKTEYVHLLRAAAGTMCFKQAIRILKLATHARGLIFPGAKDEHAKLTVTLTTGEEVLLPAEPFTVTWKGGFERALFTGVRNGGGEVPATLFRNDIDTEEWCPVRCTVQDRLALLEESGLTLDERLKRPIDIEGGGGAPAPKKAKTGKGKEVILLE